MTETETETESPMRQIRNKTSGGTTAVLITMCFGLMLSMFNSTLVNVTLPGMGASLHASPSGLQWVSTIYTLFYGALLLFGGALGNKLGRRSTFLGGTIVFVVGSLGCSLAPTMGLLLAGRVVQAIGVAVMLPQTLSILVHEHSEPAARARAIGVWAGGASLGLAAGPVLGGIILSFTTWAVTFAFSVLLGLLTVVLGVRSIPAVRHGRPDVRSALDGGGAGLVALCLSALVFALIEQVTFGWASWPIDGAFAVSVLSGIAFVWTQHVRESRGRVPLMPLGLWHSRGFIAANVAGLSYFVMYFGILYFYSLDLQQHRHFTALATGLAFLPMTILMAGFAPISGRLATVFGAAPVMVAGLAVSGVGCFLLCLVPADGRLLDLEWRFAIVGAGAGLMSSAMSNIAVSSVDAKFSSTASAVHNTFRQIGATLGVAGLGTIVTATVTAAPETQSWASFGIGLDRVMGVVAVLLIACAITVRALTRHSIQRPIDP